MIEIQANLRKLKSCRIMKVKFGIRSETAQSFSCLQKRNWFAGLEVWSGSCNSTNLRTSTTSSGCATLSELNPWCWIAHWIRDKSEITPETWNQGCFWAEKGAVAASFAVTAPVTRDTLSKSGWGILFIFRISRILLGETPNFHSLFAHQNKMRVWMHLVFIYVVQVQALCVAFWLLFQRICLSHDVLDARRHGLYLLGIVLSLVWPALFGFTQYVCSFICPSDWFNLHHCVFTKFSYICHEIIWHSTYKLMLGYGSL